MTRPSIFCVLVSIPVGIVFSPSHAAQPAVVVAPVADVWSDPVPSGTAPSDEKRETQLLFGERVLVYESSGAWARLSAVSQPEFSHHQHWEGYPGWTERRALAFFNHSPGSREAILDIAQQLQGTAYLWGGLAPWTGFDCSGLVHLAYRLNGITIPRDALDQSMKSRKIRRGRLKSADLIFSAKKETPDQISHVALYAGHGEIIEAPQKGSLVRRISFQEKFGKPMDQVEYGDQVGDRVITYGAFLN